MDHPRFSIKVASVEREGMEVRQQGTNTCALSFFPLLRFFFTYWKEEGKKKVVHKGSHGYRSGADSKIETKG